MYRNILNRQSITDVYKNIEKYIINTPLEYNKRLSNKYNANVYLKREDLQETRSFKIRGSLNKIINLNDNREIVCASAGNHAQGVAHSCNLLNLYGKIYVPNTTPLQKINRIKTLGGNNVDLEIKGDVLKESMDYALDYSRKINSIFVHPYNDLDVIKGQATIGLEILDKIEPDIVITCVGGGGLTAGLGGFIKNYVSNCRIIGVEPKGAPSMYKAFEAGIPYELNNLDTFVDGASVSKIGDIPYSILKDFIDTKDIQLVSNGHLCNNILGLYENEGIIVEPAGCLSITGLDKLERREIEGKTIVCIVSGGNNDVMRYSEIIEKNLLYLERKHYYIIKFKQKPQELKNFILNVLGSTDDITRFEYIKKTNRHLGDVLLGIETNNNIKLEKNLLKNKFIYKKIDEDDLIYNYIV